jgi:multidrug efflux pump subunit AcrB
MHSFWFFFLKRKQFTILLIGALVAAGLFCLVAIPKESAPAVVIPYGFVTTIYPGASSADVEKLVTSKLENSISTVNNLDKLTSTSADSSSVIVAQFDSNANLEKSIQDLKDAVDRAKSDLPSDAKDPVVTQINFSDQPILIYSLSGNLSSAEFTKLADDVENEILRVPGVSKVTKAGVRPRQVQVIVKKDALTQYGLSLMSVVSALAANNAAIPVGSITSSAVTYAVQFNGDITDPSEVADLPVGQSGGAPVYVRDVATVVDGVADADTLSYSSKGGAPSTNAITLAVYKKSGGDITAIAGAVKNRMTELQSTLLAPVSVLVSYDDGELVKKDLLDLTRTGFETVGLVILVLLLTIGWRESLVAGLSIPLSFTIAFIGLYLSGNTLNFISLFSLILAIGILVDSGIVVTEAIHARLAVYGDAMKAARATITEYAWPLIGGTMTTAAVFAPLFFISGITGKFIAAIPYTVIFVLLASIFVALGLVPLIAVFLTKKDGKPSRFEEKQEAYTRRVTEWYKTQLRRALDNAVFQKRFMWTLGILFCISFSLPILGLVKTEFFPQGDSDSLYIDIEQKQGTPLAETNLTARAVEEVLYSEPDIDSFTTTVGRTSEFTSGLSGNKYANVEVNLKKNRKLTSTEELEKFRKDLAPIHRADIRVSQQSGGPPVGAAVEIKLTGDDLGDLAKAADASANLLASIPGTVDVLSSTRSNGTEFELAVDKAKVAQAGLTPALVAQTLRTAINGTTATTIKKNGNDIDVVVKLDLNPAYTDSSETADTSIDAIKNLTIATPNGSVLLGSLLTPSLGVSNASITHEDKRRVETVTASLTASGNAAAITKEFLQKVPSLNLPKGVSVSQGGQTEESTKSFSDMFIALIAGLALMMGILVLTFNSFRFAAYLLMAVPLSLIGVLDGLAVTGQTLSFTSMLGFVALGGVIINHAIILMDSMIVRRTAEPNRPVRDVVVESAANRLRPILLTTITTVVGMIPLAGVSAMWAPLAFAIMFGLSFAMILTLILVPVLFYRHENAKQLKSVRISAPERAG